MANAFVSCSLRKEDKPFIDFVEEILQAYRIQPMGTVGRYSAAPINTAELMKQNIPTADMVVVVATPRYLQKDIHLGNASSGLSEMLHVESGIAYASNKPIVVFVQQGAHVGTFLPNITQYITLDGSVKDFQEKTSLIQRLLSSAYNISVKNKSREESLNLQNLVTAGLAFWGGIKILESIAEENNPRKSKKSSRY
jgi:hypothetical protein